MTDPMLVGVTVEQLVANARRLGLMWGWRPVTVKTITSPYSQDIIGGVYDGDTAVLPFTNISGSVVPDIRGFGLFVPPNGNYYVGTIGNQLEKVYAISDVASSPNFGITEVVVLTLPSVTLHSGAAYAISFGQAIASTLNFSTRVRARLTSLAGAVIADFSDFPITLVSPQNAAATAYIKRTDPVDAFATIVLTMQSTGTVSSHFGSAAIPRFMTVKYVGVASDFPHALVV